MKAPLCVCLAIAALGASPGHAQRTRDATAEAAAVAFPSGRPLQDADGVTWAFGRHRLVETSFGPVLISEGQARDASHATEGRLDLTYLGREGRTLFVRRRFPEAVRVGSFGGIGQWSVSGRFSSSPVVYAAGGFTGQGITEGCTTLTILDPSGPRLVALVPDSYDSGGSGLVRAEWTQGRITDIVRDRGFVVRYTGFHNTNRAYVWNGSKYVRQGSPVLEHCNDE